MTKKQWVFIVFIVLLIIAIIHSYSLRRDAISNPDFAPSNYSYGAVASFSFLEADSAQNATVQIVYLGQKPLLRITQLNITSCPNARVLLSAQAQTDSESENMDLGRIQYLVGNTNYELPGQFNSSSAYRVVIWCDTTNSQFAVANLR